MILRHRTFPPNLPAAARSNVPGRQLAVSCRMPILDQFRMCSRKAIGFGNTLATAVRTTVTLAPITDRCFPFVVVGCRAFPPNPLSAAGRETFWTEIAVSRRMPLSGQLRVRSVHTVGLINFLARTIGAAPSERPVADGCFPLMAQLALPPDLFVAARCQIRRGEVFVLCRMPLVSDLGMCAQRGSFT